MHNDYMPKGGVKELQRSKSGREYLVKLQKKNRIDLLQPRDPEFNKVYGAKIGRDEGIRKMQEQMCADERGINAEKKAHKEAKEKDPGFKNVH